MKTAGKFDHSGWPALRARLQNGEANAWQEAVDLLQQRIGGRYLDHATAIMSLPYSGFAVLAIDCLVIEALQQFREGVDESNSVETSFVRFLKETRFNLDRHVARKFYFTIRNGLLHQAETKEDSLINKSKKSPQPVQRAASGTGVVVNARRFHEELRLAFAEYKNALLAGQPQSLRDSFILKMNFINRVPPGQAQVVI